MASNESKIPVGTVLVGKYRVVREIGRGGMAAVYEAEQLSLGKKVAVKVLAAELSASTIVIERFFREARAAASVKSPYIVDVYDSGRLDDGRPFIAMELLEGESLYDRMARVRLIDVDTTIRVIVHTAKGLVKAHAAGIVHRDLKPENIFLSKGEDGEDLCKILDFGLAKFYAPVNPEEKAQKRLTREGAVFGTPAYMSPEQVKGQGNVDHRADLWALGCMAYECLIGRPVWNMDQGVAMTFAAIATGPIPVPSQIRPDLPPAFDAWFKKCLERDPDRRFQSARELADAFVEAWGQRPNSSASYPNVPQGARYAPQMPAAGGVGGEAHELAADVLESVRPPPRPGSPPASPASGRGPGLNGNAGRGSVESDGSMPLPLVQRSSNMTTDSAIAQPISVVTPRPSALRYVFSATLLAASLSAAGFVWVRFVRPQVFTPIVASTVKPVPSAVPSGSSLPTAPVVDEPKWASAISEGQRLFTSGDVAGAQKKFKDAIDQGAGAVGRVYFDQAKVAATVTGPCKIMAFGRPRISTEKRAERPAIAATSGGALVTWTDDHEQDKHSHVYGVKIDATGKDVGPIRDLTPEATEASRPQLAAGGSDRMVLLYWDEKGRDAGVRVRMLDAEGRIDTTRGQSVLVGAARPGQYWPSIERAPQGFFVAWQDDRDKEGDYDLFVRRLTSELETTGPETRLTDYVAGRSKTGAPRVRFPSVAVAANSLVVAYRLEREREHLVMRMRVPLSDLERGGLEEVKESRNSRELGDVTLVSEDKAPADAPAVACGAEGCFIAWHGEPSGVFAAMIDPKEGRVIWRKRFSDKGGHPSLATGDGRVAVAYYEGGRLKMAFLSRDGVSASNALLRVVESSGAPRPSVSAGSQPGEWYLAWQDADAPKGSPEIYASRVLCR